MIERIYNSEKFYIQLLKNAISTYLTDLPDDLRTNLKPYLNAINRIAKFHTEIFYPKLLQCDMKTITICDLIKTCLDSLEFNIYFKYSAFVHEALQLIQNLNSVRISTFPIIYTVKFDLYFGMACGESIVVARLWWWTFLHFSLLIFYV